MGTTNRSVKRADIFVAALAFSLLGCATTPETNRHTFVPSEECNVLGTWTIDGDHGLILGIYGPGTYLSSPIVAATLKVQGCAMSVTLEGRGGKTLTYSWEVGDTRARARKCSSGADLSSCRRGFVSLSHEPMTAEQAEHTAKAFENFKLFL